MTWPNILFLNQKRNTMIQDAADHQPSLSSPAKIKTAATAHCVPRVTLAKKEEKNLESKGDDHKDAQSFLGRANQFSRGPGVQGKRVVSGTPREMRVANMTLIKASDTERARLFFFIFFFFSHQTDTHNRGEKNADDRPSKMKRRRARARDRHCYVHRTLTLGIICMNNARGVFE